MNLQTRRDIRSLKADHHEAGICEKLLLLSNRFDHRHARLVARINEGTQGYRWIDSAITSIGTMESGDLLMTFGARSDAAATPQLLDLQSATALIRQPDLRNHRRLLFGTHDGGESLFVCRSIDVAGWQDVTVYMTFVPAGLARNAGRPGMAH